MNCGVYECAVSYNPRSYEEGKKIGWRDGLHALYCILRYSAPTAPLPMQILIYLFIGLLSMTVDLAAFSALTYFGCGIEFSVVAAFSISAICNYILCIAILFRHKARWGAFQEFFVYVVSVMAMCLADYFVTVALIGLGLRPFWAKFWGAVMGFLGNFLVRRYLVFPEKKKCHGA
jgi:putative flippase GtrA